MLQLFYNLLITIDYTDAPRRCQFLVGRCKIAARQFLFIYYIVNNEFTLHHVAGGAHLMIGLVRCSTSFKLLYSLLSIIKQVQNSR